MTSGESQTPDLSIIIVAWNTRDLLLQCLTSIYNDTYEDDLEVIVVDNASTDGSVERVRSQFPSVTLIPNETNVGFAQGNNQAIHQAAGRYILLLNPDTELKPDSISALRRFMEAHPDAGAAGPRLLNPDGTLQPSCYPAPTLARELWRLFHLDALWSYGSYNMGAWEQRSPREVDTVQGACLLVRREVLDEVGVLDEQYFIYSEEVDLCLRIRRHGWKIYWVPEAEVVHFGGQSTKQVAGEMFLQLYESKILYFRKHHGRSTTLLYKFVLLTAAVARLLLTPLAWLEQAPQRRQHLALAANYRRLVTRLPHF